MLLKLANTVLILINTGQINVSRIYSISDHFANFDDALQVIESKKYCYSHQVTHNMTVDNTSRVYDLFSVRQNNLMF